MHRRSHPCNFIIVIVRHSDKWDLITVSIEPAAVDSRWRSDELKSTAGEVWLLVEDNTC
jgi:hypothetical protein